MTTPLDDIIASYLNFRDDRKQKGKQFSIERILVLVAIFIITGLLFGLPHSILGVLILIGFNISLSEYVLYYFWKNPEKLNKIKNIFK